MKNLYQTVAIALLAAGSVLFTVGCSKNSQTYKADPTNPYANPNPPKQFDDPRPTMSAFAPTRGLPGTVVTISGTNLSLSNVVTINGVKATVNAVSIIDMTITVPANATTGPIVITDGTTTLTSSSNFVVTSGTVSNFYDLGTSNIRNIVFDKDGNMFGDDGVKTIYKLPKGGALNVYATANSNAFNSVWGVVVYSVFGNIYTIDKTGYRVVRINTDGAVTPFAGDGSAGYRDDVGTLAQFAAPSSIAMAPDGTIYIVDLHRIRKITTANAVTTLAGGNDDGFTDGKGADARFGNLEGIATDADGNVYVSDSKYLRIRKITKDGVVTTLAGNGNKGFVDGTAANAQFYFPGALAVDPISGNLFVTDQNPLAPQYEIRVINKNGVVNTLLKGTSNTGVINGPTATASTNAPNGIAFDINGVMYIVNSGAKLISKVTFQ